jgi:SPP1 family predicted phage head-tail adaptor
MRAGLLDRRITIQRKSVTQSGSGQSIETWSTLVQRMWAQVSPVSGDERFTQPQYAAKEQTEFRIRWAQAIADLSPLDRIIYPAVGISEQPAPASIYDILSVGELGRRETLQIIAFRRADV